MAKKTKTVNDTMSTSEKLGRIMDDFKREVPQSVPHVDGKISAGKSHPDLVQTIVDRLVTNDVNLAEVSLWDMKRLMRDAALVRVGRSVQSDTASRTAS